jgi:hypothetical protein
VQLYGWAVVAVAAAEIGEGTAMAEPTAAEVRKTTQKIRELCGRLSRRHVEELIELLRQDVQDREDAGEPPPRDGADAA